MKMHGEQRIAASRQAVWAALNDPEVLKKSIPGCKDLEKRSPTEFAATVVAKVGPVKATFKGDVKLSNIKKARSYVISGQGKGGAAGFAKGQAEVTLAEDGGETVLAYDVDAQVGGKLAQIGSRLIDQTAKKMADQFFKAFAREVTSPTPAAKTKKAAAKKPGSKTAAGKSAKPAASKSAKATANAEPAPAPTRTRPTRPPAKVMPGGVFWWVAVAGAAVWLVYFLTRSL